MNLRQAFLEFASTKKNMSINKEKTHVGIDVSKQFIDVALGKSFKRFTNNKEGFTKMLDWLSQLRVKELLHVIFEPSGGYEIDLAEFLQKQKIAWSRPNAFRVRQYAKAKGIMAKTDKIDAYILADYGVQFQPKAQQLNKESLCKLQEIMKRRDQVVQMLVMEKVALESVRDALCRKEIKNSLRRFERDIERLESEALKCLDNDEELKNKAEIMQQFSGVGQQTALILTAFLPELGLVNRQEIASLGGMAPVTRESGKWKGKAMLGPGRVRVRKALYMAALSASRCNSVLSVVYKRLRDQGKPAKVALCAIARKLLVAINAKLKEEVISPT